MPRHEQPSHPNIIERLLDPVHADDLRSAAAEEIGRLCRKVDVWVESSNSAVRRCHRLQDQLEARDLEIERLRAQVHFLSAMWTSVGPNLPTVDLTKLN